VIIRISSSQNKVFSMRVAVLKNIRNLFARTDDYDADASSILSSCMSYISTRLNKHLSGQHYRWKDNERIKTLECLILSKFLIDYALSTAFTGRITETRREFYLKMTDTVFVSILKTTFPLFGLSDYVRNRLEIYSSIMSDASDQTCWQRLAGACTGIDYYSKKDLPTFTASSLVLPALLRSAQVSWGKVIYV
jgi:hypothetical protein